MVKWVALPGFDNYLISSDGQICGPRGIRKRQYKSAGYPFIILWKNNKRINLNVHRLVCEAFNGPPPFEGAQALHKDGIKDNCTKDNMYWGTPKQNSQDTIEAGNFQRGEKHYRTKLTWDQVREIRRRVAAGEKQVNLCKEFGIRGPVCSQIVNNITWRE